MRCAPEGPGTNEGQITVISTAIGDTELIARMAAGDEAALAVAYDRHVDAIYGCVVQTLGNREAAEAVIQDVYRAAWQQAAQYTASAGSLLGWLLGIARTKTIDRAGATERRPMLVVVGGRDHPAGAMLAGVHAAGRRTERFGEGELGTDNGAAQAWGQAVVRTALASMPEADRQALLLAYQGGLSQAEIADRLGLTLATVNARTRRALAVLRTALDGVPDVADDADDTGGAGAELRAAVDDPVNAIGVRDAAR